jgi:hypothetical protein
MTMDGTPTVLSTRGVLGVPFNFSAIEKGDGWKKGTGTFSVNRINQFHSAISHKWLGASLRATAPIIQKH